jgi:hypothetical protein
MSSTEPATPFEPTITFPDGDIILKSSDGVELRVHKLMLRLASPVFASMLEMPEPASIVEPGQPQTVELEETASTLDNLLRCAYPFGNKLLIEDIDQLVTLLRAANKYELECAITVLHQEMIRLVPLNPLKCYAIAVRFGVLAAAQASVRRIVKMPPHLATHRDLPREFRELTVNQYAHLENFCQTCRSRAAQSLEALYMEESQRNMAKGRLFDDSTYLDLAQHIGGRTRGRTSSGRFESGSPSEWSDSTPPSLEEVRETIFRQLEEDIGNFELPQEEI